MKNTLIYSFSWIALYLFLASCSNEAEEQPANVHKQLKLYADIVSSTQNTTRATVDEYNSSYNAFAVGDMVGLYSRDGNLDGNGFINIPLRCGITEERYSVFLAENLNVDYNRLQPALAYYPYYENMEAAGDQGMPIRRADGTVEDFLCCHSYSLTAGNGYISGGFEHAGARLIITCGDGFDKVADQEITVRMNLPFKYFKVVDGDNSSYYYYKVCKYVPAAESEATEADYIYTTQPAQVDGKTAYFAILPTCTNHIGGEEGSIMAKVESITLKDNSGTIRTVNVASYIGDGQLWRGNSYRLTIRLEELVPTIYPYTIEDWGETTITTEAGTGINNIDDLNIWMQQYNQNRSSSNTALAKFGHFDGSDENGQWLFYLTGDINCSSISNVAVFLNDFKDKLDGRGYTLSNITLKSGAEGGAGFVGNLSPNAVIENLNIAKITINDTGGKSIGTIASVISGGTVENCTIEGLNVVGSGYAGALAGEMNGGSVSGCTFIGTVVGKRNDTGNKLVGNSSGASAIEGNNAANVIYNDIQ